MLVAYIHNDKVNFITWFWHDVTPCTARLSARRWSACPPAERSALRAHAFWGCGFGRSPEERGWEWME